MTEVELRSKVANWLVQYLGIAEGSAKHLDIINTYNESGLCTRYKMTTKDSWCATATSAAFIATGMAGKAGSGKLFECVECSCGNMVKLAQAQKIWVEADNYSPKVGDIVLYDWNDSGSGDNTGWPDHVGIVNSVSGDTFKVIEGNNSDTVAYKTMKVNGKYIRGFITPNYAKYATAVVTENKNTTSEPNKTCKFKGTITGCSVLNVRSGAGTSGTKVIKTIKKGTVVEVCDIVKDKDGDDWYYIKESGSYGFVYCEYVAKENVTASKPTTNTSTSTGLNKTCKFKGVVSGCTSLNVRSWAGAEYDKLRVIKKGTVVEVCDQRKATTGKVWYYIKESGKYGFVSSEYIAR